MRKEYDFSKARKKPYSKNLKKQISTRFLKIQLTILKILQRIMRFLPSETCKKMLEALDDAYLRTLASSRLKSKQKHIKVNIDDL